MSCLFAVLVSCDVFRCASTNPECPTHGKLCVKLRDQQGLCFKATDVNVVHVSLLHDLRNCIGKGNCGGY